MLMCNFVLHLNIYGTIVGVVDVYLTVLYEKQDKRYVRMCAPRLHS